LKSKKANEQPKVECPRLERGRQIGGDHGPRQRSYGSKAARVELDGTLYLTAPTTVRRSACST